MAHIAPSWYEVGAALLEEEQEADLKVIGTTYGNDVKKCCVAMFRFWVDTHPKATWHRLVTALRSPGVDLDVVASDITKNFTSKNDVCNLIHITVSLFSYALGEFAQACVESQRCVESTQTCIEDDSTVSYFSECETITDAFTKLKALFIEELSNIDFKKIKTICISSADNKQLQHRIRGTTDIHNLFDLLTCNRLYFNWMNVENLRIMANAARSKSLQTIYKEYIDIVYTKTLGEIWNSLPSFQTTRTKYYNEVRATFPRDDPDSITVKDLQDHAPKLAEKIALHIRKTIKGSLTITWCILAEETYQAYLLALSTPQELRKADSFQIGTWTVFHPQCVIQEVKKFHS